MRLEGVLHVRGPRMLTCDSIRETNIKALVNHSSSGIILSGLFLPLAMSLVFHKPLEHRILSNKWHACDVPHLLAKSLSHLLSIEGLL